MPIYEYRCESCGHQQEFLQKVSDAPLTVCTACGKETFSKLLSAAGFQLKGSGWYATDFKNNGKKTAAKDAVKGDAAKGEGAKSDGAKSEGAKGDAKGSGGSESKKDASGPARGVGGSAASS